MRSQQAHHVHTVLLEASFVKVDHEDLHVTVASLDRLLQFLGLLCDIKQALFLIFHLIIWPCSNYSLHCLQLISIHSLWLIIEIVVISDSKVDDFVGPHLEVSFCRKL